ncbi:MAG TPA: hypothetical protein VFN42_06545, partial [Acetobacteraceae bacterium]|nr:hypothetical protein [Acetobacteraceae bacterium]
MTELYWLPTVPDWRDRLRALPDEPLMAWEHAVALANARLNFVQTNSLDAALRQRVTAPPAGIATKPERLAVLGSATLAHLLPAIRVGGLRRGIWIDTYEGEFGQYMQELADPPDALRDFAPTAVLLALDAHHLTAELHPSMDSAEAEAALAATVSRVRDAWRQARAAFRCPVIHQAALPLHLPLLGHNEHRLPGSRAGALTRLNAALREAADADGVDILALDDRAAVDGLLAWHKPTLWHHAKQEISPVAAPLYGDLVARLLAARQGRVGKCLVLDLDNTLWGGVIGDDGLEGIVLGQGS